MTETDDSNINYSELPKSTLTENTYKDFTKICRAYYNELMHISKSPSPSLSKEDIIVIDDLIKEISGYSSDLIKLSYIKPAKSLIDIGLVIIDFLLKIFGSLPSLSKDNSNLVDKLSYPLSRKLLLLEANFNILFKYEYNYTDGERNLDEIIEIQKCLNLPSYNIASSRFYMAIIKFYQNDLEKAEKLSNEALDLLEMKGEKEKEETNTALGNRKARKMSNILEFLAELYELKKDYRKVIACYERAYYFNLGRYGGQNVNTEYFKTKLDIVNDEMKKYSSYDNNNNSNNIYYH